MKVIILWETEREAPLARNLVAVLKSIGTMLIYGKVEKTGVRLENWQNQSQVKIECVAGPSPTMPESMRANRVAQQYSTELDYVDGIGYRGVLPLLQPSPRFETVDKTPGTLGITRELMRDLVRLFPTGEGEAAIAKAKRTKPVVPRPKTTPTGVTVRDLDIWEDDEHAN